MRQAPAPRQRDKFLDERLRPPALPRLDEQDLARRIRRAGGVIGALSSQRIVRVGEAHNLGQQRRAALRQAVRIPAPIGTLVVRPDNGAQRAEAVPAGAQDIANHRVALHDVVLRIGERPGREQETVRYRDLADIVEQAASMERDQIRIGQLQGNAERRRIAATRAQCPRV